MGKEFFGLKIDKEEIDRLFADLPRATKIATARSLDITARKVNKEVRTHISKNYNIPKGATKFGVLVNIKRANVKANIGRAVIFIKKKGRTLIEYGAKQVGTGLSVKIKKNTELIKSAYLSPLRKGGPKGELAFKKATGSHAGLVTRRTKKGTPYKVEKRQILYGPQIANLYTNKSAEKVILRIIDETFQKTLDDQFSKQFEKKGRR